MSDERSPQPSEPGEQEQDWERRRRLAEAFGEVLPDTTADERDDSPGRERGADTWLREQVPPHHGS